MVRVALLGCGTMGKTHAQCYRFLQDVKVVAVCDIRTEKAQEIASLLGCDAVFSFEALNLGYTYDVLDICLPTYLHAEYAIAAMNTAKHVFCEKPIALCLEDAERMIQTAKENAVVISIGHVLRFFPQYVQAVRTVEEGRLGTVRLIRTSRNQAFPPWSWEHWYQDTEKSGGPEIDLAIHDYDWILHNFGPVQRVYAKNLSRNGQMHSLAILRLANGTIAHVEASWALPKGIEFRTTFELIGTEGELCYDSSKDCPLKVQVSDDEKNPISYDNPLNDGANPYCAELKAFFDAVQMGTKPPVSVEEAKQALRLSLAVLESAKTGTVVKLQEVRA